VSAALEIRGLRFAYPDGREALRGVDLTVAAGERVAVLGPNGAGKTTLVLHLNGILQPQAGEVVVGGLPVTKANLATIRQRVAIVFQDPDDQLFMSTVRDDVAFGPANAGLRGEDLDGRVQRALAGVGMGDHVDRAPHHLSFGQRRRVAVATVLAMEPELLVLDEPTRGVDPERKEELVRLLRSEAPLRGTLVVTHDLAWAAGVADRVVELDVREGVRA
jgi:cobalt/nickel transport system ATP-binding protein